MPSSSLVEVDVEVEVEVEVGVEVGVVVGVEVEDGVSVEVRKLSLSAHFILLRGVGVGVWEEK